jgi:heme A synthase
MFSWPYSHLLINHFPVVSSVVALGATILALIVRRRGLWQAAMGALTIAGAFVYPVHFTGDKAGEALKEQWFIAPGAMRAHDQAAEIAMWVILAAGLFAAYCWWRSLKRPQEIIPGWVRAGVFVAALGAVGTVTYTAYLGGKIIHEAPILQMRDAPAGLPPGIAAPKPR